MSTDIIERLQQGPASSKELQAVSGMSQPSVSILLRRLGDQIVKLGSGRYTRYALRRNAFDAGNRIPLYTIDAHGNAVTAAVISPIAPDGYFVESTNATPKILLGHDGSGLYEDLPFFLEDLRPQGFLGRQLAHRLAESTDFPSDPRTWTAEQIGSFLVASGDDLPGNFKFGRQSLLREPPKLEITTRDEYPERANEVIHGSHIGSSAGGEQAKFIAFNEEHEHVIVKFSPPGEDKIALRMRDILITEHHAEQVLRRNSPHTFSAANTHLHEIEGRLFLESVRFDRHGDIGRLPMMSLRVIDAEFVGLGTNWADVMLRLYDLDLVTSEHVADCLLLQNFGRLINNTDMHLGNLSLAHEGPILKILPAYDMCSMGFAPKSGQALPYDFNVDLTSESAINKYGDLPTDLAIEFWDELANDERISDELRAFLDKGNPIKT